MATLKSTIRKYLLAGVAKQAGVAVLEAQLVEARGGMYACSVQAAIAAKGDKAAFVETVDSLMDDFRSNKRNIATKFEMDQAQDKHGKLKVDNDGNPVYKVPGSLSTAKSVLASGFDHGIDLGTISKPNSFGSIRDAAQHAKAEQAVANATPDDKVRASIAGHLESIASQIAKLDTKSLKALNTLLAATVKAHDKAIKEAA